MRQRESAQQDRRQEDGTNDQAQNPVAAQRGIKDEGRRHDPGDHHPKGDEAHHEELAETVIPAAFLDESRKETQKQEYPARDEPYAPRVPG